MPDDQSDARPDETADADDLMGTLHKRVEDRRRGGQYPPNLEEDLDQHFVRLTRDRPASPAFLMDELEHALNNVQHFKYTRERISYDSKVPGGGGVHRAIGATVSRQVQGVLEQAQEQSQFVARALTLVFDVMETINDAFDRRILQQLDDLQVRLAEQLSQLNVLTARLEDVSARMPGTILDTWYSGDVFTKTFRGEPDVIRERYADLAKVFAGCDPVLDAGCGRGEFVELLVALGIDARGIEVDPKLVADARARGVRAETSGVVEHLLTLPDASLGGLAMIQVIEHLTPQDVIDVVKIAADKVRPGGRVVVETVNPTSLYTYAHALWVDPDHVRPIHPGFLRFLFNEAGFTSIDRVDRSPVDPGESLEMLSGDDETAKRLNANFERLNSLLFGPQDYAIVATR